VVTLASADGGPLDICVVIGGAAGGLGGDVSVRSAAWRCADTRAAEAPPTCQAGHVGDHLRPQSPTSGAGLSLGLASDSLVWECGRRFWRPTGVYVFICAVPSARPAPIPSVFRRTARPL